MGMASKGTLIFVINFTVSSGIQVMTISFSLFSMISTMSVVDFWDATIFCPICFVVFYPLDCCVLSSTVVSVPNSHTPVG